MLSPSSPRLLWTAAGCPTPEGAIPYVGRCLWCGQDATGVGRDRKNLPDTFFDAVGKDCADLHAPHLCAACGWTLSDGVRLPIRVGTRMLNKALAPDGDGRVSLDLPQTGWARCTVRPLDDGRIAAWVRPSKPAEEKRIREEGDPSSAAVVLAPEPMARLVTGKFRNFHAFASGSNWDMLTGGEKPRLREILLAPPDAPWTLTIGDGQKHEAIYGEVSYPGGLQVTRFQGAVIHYDPPDLAALIVSIEALSFAGAREEEILSGRYSRSGLDWTLAYSAHEPTIQRRRGAPILGMALFLRRPVAELRAASCPSDLGHTQHRQLPHR